MMNDVEEAFADDEAQRDSRSLEEWVRIKVGVACAVLMRPESAPPGLSQMQARDLGRRNRQANCGSFRSNARDVAPGRFERAET
jgi:hypothetical protein